MVLFRWAGFVMLAPVFGAKTVPTYIKIGLAMAFTVVVFPIVSHGYTPPSNLIEYGMALVQETMVGLSIGFISQKILYVLQGAGQIIDLQMGLAIGSLLDPINGVASPLSGNFYTVVATLLLLATNAHYYLIAAMVRSYSFIPLQGSIQINHSLVDFAMQFVTGTFVESIQIALPIWGVLVITEIFLGFVSKALPQMNIFALSFPLKIILGFLLMIWVLSAFSVQVDNLVQDMLNQMYYLLKGLG
ncbi:MAG: flagellar biosynthetic protein FliR [Peptococcaceae bacterium]|nr:flagellar biosynthetic protein FliR [Peptococcaceae bacterium]